MSDAPQGPGWWQASDGNWYPPETQPGGPPTPGPGAQPGMGAVAPGAVPAGSPEQYADWVTRVVATLIDAACTIAVWIVVFIIAMILGQIATALGVLFGFVGYLGALAIGFYFAYLTGETGQSPGKRVMGIKVVEESTGQPIGGAMGIVRQIAHAIDSFICMIGYLFPLWDPKRQTIADKVLSTVVLPNQPKQSFGPDIFKP